MKFAPLISVALWPLSAWLGVHAWNEGLWPLTVLAIMVSAVALHSMIIAVHEAAHGTLFTSKRLNYGVGLLAGTITLSPVSVYRMLHRFHHGFLATEDDLEFWPYVNRSASRAQRVAAAITELTFSSPYFICMFYRSVIVGRISDRVRRQCYLELTLASAVALAVIVYVAMNNFWAAYLISYIIPIQAAGLLVSWRRLTEHLGLFGSEIDRMTRLVIPTNPVERFFCTLFFNEPLHSAHHKEPTADWTTLRHVSEEMLRTKPSLQELHFRSYVSAVPHMLRHIANPRMGKQWLVD